VFISLYENNTHFMMFRIYLE